MLDIFRFLFSRIIQSGGCQDFSDNNARLWNTFRYRLRQKLFLDRDNGPTKRSYFSENAVWIVAHIRRGDISLGDRGRGSSFSDIFRILSNVTAVCRAGGRQCRLTVHTEKLRSDVAADLEEDDKQIEQLRAQLAADVLRDAPPLSAWIDMVRGARGGHPAHKICSGAVAAGRSGNADLARLVCANRGL